MPRRSNRSSLVGKFVRVADVVAASRDEHGRPLLKNIVHIAIAMACEEGRVTAIGCACDEQGEPGALAVIPVKHWFQMAFPIASQNHMHATFWHRPSDGHVAYTDIAVNVNEWLSYQSDLAAKSARLNRLLTAKRKPRQRSRASPVADRIICWFKSLGPVASRSNPHALADSWLRD
jgi:hypothetical protein